MGRLAVWARPRLATGLRFDLDRALDEKLEFLFRRHHLGDQTAFAPFGSGLAIEGREEDEAVSRIEVREDGTIRGAWALPAFDDEGGKEGKDRPWIRFDEVADRLVGAARFAAAAYGARRTAAEFEFFFGLHRCQDYRVVVPDTRRGRPVGVIYDPTAFASYRGRVPGHPIGHQPTYGSASLRTEGDGFDAEPVGEDLLRLVRSASHTVGISAPDARLEHYLR